MKGKKGYILILTLLVIGALFFFGVLFLKFFRDEQKLALGSEHKLVATEAANGGIEDALYHLKQDSSWKTGFDNEKLPHSGASYSMSFNKKQTAVPYSTNNSGGTSTVTGYNGREVPPGVIHLVSLGRFGNSTKVEEAMITTGTSLFDSAVFTNSEINLRGNVKIDSYDSSSGNYNVTQTDSGGNIGTNSSGGGSVSLNGNVDVYGGISVGTGGTEGSSVSSSGNSSYQSFNTSDPKTLDFFTPPAGTNQGSVIAQKGLVSPLPGTYTDLIGSSRSTIQLQTGTYVFTGDINLSGGAAMEIPPGAGPVTIYVLGDISISGGSQINPEGTPGNLLIIGGPETKKVEINGNGEAYFGLYAPAADVTVFGNGRIYGSVVSDKLNINGNAGIHFDKALESVSLSGEGVTVKSRW